MGGVGWQAGWSVWVQGACWPAASHRACPLTTHPHPHPHPGGGCSTRSDLVTAWPTAWAGGGRAPPSTTPASSSPPLRRRAQQSSWPRCALPWRWGGRAGGRAVGRAVGRACAWGTRWGERARAPDAFETRSDDASPSTPPHPTPPPPTNPPGHCADRAHRCRGGSSKGGGAQFLRLQLCKQRGAGALVALHRMAGRQAAPGARAPCPRPPLVLPPPPPPPHCCSSSARPPTPCWASPRTCCSSSARAWSA